MDFDGSTAIALGGFRVVKSGFFDAITRIEYEFVVSTSNVTRHVWRSITDFQRLATNLGVFDSKGDRYEKVRPGLCLCRTTATHESRRTTRVCLKLFSF